MRMIMLKKRKSKDLKKMTQNQMMRWRVMTITLLKNTIKTKKMIVVMRVIQRVKMNNKSLEGIV